MSKKRKAIKIFALSASLCTTILYPAWGSADFGDGTQVSAGSAGVWDFSDDSVDNAQQAVPSPSPAASQSQGTSQAGSTAGASSPETAADSSAEASGTEAPAGTSAGTSAAAASDAAQPSDAVPASDSVPSAAAETSSAIASSPISEESSTLLPLLTSGSATVSTEISQDGQVTAVVIANSSGINYRYDMAAGNWTVSTTDPSITTAVFDKAGYYQLIEGEDFFWYLTPTDSATAVPTPGIYLIDDVISIALTAEKGLAQAAGTSYADLPQEMFAGLKSTEALSGFVKIGDKTYYVDAKTGKIAKGWIVDSNKIYHADENGCIEKGSVVISGTSYSLSAKTGALQKGLWKIDGKYYYINKSGQRQSGWVTYKGNKYYFNKKTYAANIGLVGTKVKYYFNKKGILQTGFVKISGKTYFFNKTTGKMVHGFFKDGQNTYYTNSNGILQKGFTKINGTVYGLSPKDGHLLYGLVKLNGKYYCMTDKGVVRTGWVTYNGNRYYFNKKTYAANTGLVGTKVKYYFNSQGIMQTGLITINNKQYYFKSSGALLTNYYAFKIGDSWYNASASGVLSKVTNSMYIMACEKMQSIGSRDLKTLFDYCVNLTYIEDIGDVPAGWNKCDYFAYYGFTTGTGDCHVKACTCYMFAKILGYDVHYVSGYVPTSSGSLEDHGWCEIIVNGTTYLLDPEFAHTMSCFGYTTYTGYMITYGQAGTYQYTDYSRVN